MSLNYKRLHTFWMVTREGTLRRAAEQLHISEPAVSVQLKKLQQWVGEPLFEKEGRRLVLTELGQVVKGYADRIFQVGDELTDVLRGRTAGATARMRVGTTQTIPKTLVVKLLEPAFELGTFQIEIVEGTLDRLTGQLAVHELELALSDRPVASNPSVRIFAHLLGRSGVSLLATPALAEDLGSGTDSGDDPGRLANGPWLLPGGNSPMRTDLERWFRTVEARPTVVGEFQDSALLKAFAADGLGIIAVPTAVEAEVCATFGLVTLRRLPHVEESFFALTVERKISHPGVQAVLEQGVAETFRPLAADGEDRTSSAASPKGSVPTG